MHSSDKDEKNSDPRVAGIATVGWVTLSALALCIPLTASVGVFSGAAAMAIPLAVILGAGVMAVRIWSSGERTVNQAGNDELANRIGKLEERLANLEMIDSVEAHFAEKHRAPGVTSSLGPARSSTMGPRPETVES